MPDPRSEPGSARLRRGRGSVLLAVLIAIVVGCGSTTATATPPPAVAPSPSAPSVSPQPSSASAAPSQPPASQDTAAVYQTIEEQVVAIRGLHPKAPVNPTVLDDAGIKKFVADSFDKDNPPAIIAANERIMKALGMLPPDASLKDLYIKLLGGQVAGLYSPDDKKLYVVSRSGGLGPAEKTTFSHEFTHALQDQNFDLGSLKLDEIGQGDRSFARLSLVEGDATLSMSYWQAANLTLADLTELVKQSQADPSANDLLAMPPILRESLLFPYIQGLAFVQGLQTSGGWKAVDAAFGKPPASTEQILHPDKYASGEAPVAVDLPDDLPNRLGPGWRVPLEDSFGEFQLGIWLRQSPGLSAADAGAAAAGWGGDRVAVVTGPAGAWGVVLRTSWDTTADAAAFEKAASPLVATLSDPASVLPGAGGKERWVVVGSDDATLNRLAGALGLAG